MRSITLSASENLIDAARQKAQEQNKTLNQVFREWLESYTRREDARAIDAIYERPGYLNLGGPKITRQEMNER